MFKHTKIKSVTRKQNPAIMQASRRVTQTLIEKHTKFSFAVRKIMQVAQKSCQAKSQAKVISEATK